MTASEETIVQLPLTSLTESPFNPRRTFNEQALHDLAASIQGEGRVHEPLLVRPMVPPMFNGDPDGITGHEVVFGHRRLRAAAIAGLATVPCMVRTMTDEEARRAQIAENLQRADVHPIEEAEGFQALIDCNAETADTLAAKIGKSRSYVYGRLKLLQAVPEIRNACLAGEIGSEVALLIARLRSEKLQAKALEKIRSEAYRFDMKDGGQRSFRAIRDMLNERFALELKHAIFPIEDVTLRPAAGACGPCPKRTANAPEFADIAADKKKHEYDQHKLGPDVCTDPDCFDDKKKAHLKREQLALEAKGKTVIAGAKARTVIDAGGNIKNGYMPLAEAKAALKKAKVSDAAQLDLVATVQDPRTGKTKQVVKIEDLKAAGVKIAGDDENDHASATRRNAASDADRLKAEARAEKQTLLNKAVLNAIRSKLVPAQFGMRELRTIVAWAVEQNSYGEDEAMMVELWGANILPRLPTMTPDELHLLLLDCVMVRDIEASRWDSKPRLPAHLADAAAHYGIDVDSVKAGIVLGVDEPAEPEPAPPKKATKAKAAPASQLSPVAAWPFPTEAAA